MFTEFVSTDIVTPIVQLAYRYLLYYLQLILIVNNNVTDLLIYASIHIISYHIITTFVHL